MQGFDAPAARVVFGRGQFSVHRRVGLIETFVLRAEQPVQHPPDFTGFRAHWDSLEAHFTLAHDLQQTVRVECDFGNIRPGRREEQVEETEAQ